MKSNPINLHKIAFQLLWIIGAGLLLIHCRGDEYISSETQDSIGNPDNTEIKGFYLLNEGVMGSNKSTLDFYHYQDGIYHRNIYAAHNPNVIKELGDVGNDLKIYGGKLYAIINVSNKIEVIDAKTVKKIKTIPLENCRYITFHQGKAYISSYAGAVSLDPKSPLGKVVEVDTLSLNITRQVTVGYQPEELVVNQGKLFVANSGGYKFPNYDNTISVIDLNTFTQEKKYPVAINLHRLVKDQQGDLYVSSRGDYQDIPSSLFLVDSKTGIVKKDFKIAVNGMTLVNNKIYYFGNEFNYNNHSSKKNFGIIDVTTEEIISTQMIEKKYEDEIQTPYGIAVNPITEDIYITDAANYTPTGYLYAFDKNGKFKWKTETGNIPAHFAFLYKKKK